MTDTVKSTSIRLPREVVDAVDRMAAKARRSRNVTIELILTEAAVAAGELAPEEPGHAAAQSQLATDPAVDGAERR